MMTTSLKTCAAVLAATTTLATGALAGGADLQVFDWSGYEDQGFLSKLPYQA